MIAVLLVVLFFAGVAAGAAVMYREHPDRARVEWIRANATSVCDGYDAEGRFTLHAATHARVLITEFELPVIPRDQDDWTRAAIDLAIAEGDEDQIVEGFPLSRMAD